MTEFEKIQRAKMYIDKLARGVNPLDDTAIPDGDIVNNVRISRCLFYVSDILGDVIDGNTVARKEPKKSKAPFFISDEARKTLIPSDGTVTAKDITERLNSLIEDTATTKLKATTIGAWLVSIEMLEIVADERGKSTKRPTETGRQAGIYTVDRISQYGFPYKTVCYSKEAQQFIFDNLDAIIEQNSIKPNRVNQGTPWSVIDDELLRDLHKNGATVREMSVSLSRSPGAIRASLERLGVRPTE